MDDHYITQGELITIILMCSLVPWLIFSGFQWLLFRSLGISPNKIVISVVIQLIGTAVLGTFLWLKMPDLMILGIPFDFGALVLSPIGPFIVSAAIWFVLLSLYFYIREQGWLG